MNYLESIVLGVVEGLTEFLPVSSTGHLTIAEKILGLPIDDDGVTAYTAVIQMGAIAAVVLYFFKDIVSIVRGWFGGVFQASRRGTLEYRMAGTRSSAPSRSASSASWPRTSSPGRSGRCGGSEAH